MPRTTRMEYKGALYHVMCRGNNGEHILVEEEKEKYVKYILKYKEKYKFDIYAYCIMSNHVHLLLETGEVPLSRIMQGIQQSFTQYYNKKYNRTGHVFQQRYKALLCNKESYLWQLIKYIHKNPVEAGFQQGLNYEWSSHKSYLSGKSDPLVDVKYILGMLSTNPAVAQKEYLRLMRIEPEEISFEEYLTVLQKESIQLNDSIQPTDSTMTKEVDSKEIKFDDIIGEVSKESDIAVEDILRRSKIQKYSDARKAIVRLCDKFCDISRKDLAEKLNLQPSMISKILSGEIRGTQLVDELVRRFEERFSFESE